MDNRKLINYLPEVLRNFREFEKTFEVEQPEFEKLWEEVSKVLKDQFVSDSTERGVLRWEKLLKIVPKATDSLEVRKVVILGKLNRQLPYTFKRLYDLLTIICGENEFEIELHHDIYLLLLKGDLVIKERFAKIYALLQEVVPANVVVDFILLYNQHLALEPFTHGQLEGYKHIQLRNEVLN